MKCLDLMIVNCFRTGPGMSGKSSLKLDGDGFALMDEGDRMLVKPGDMGFVNERGSLFLRH